MVFTSYIFVCNLFMQCTKCGQKQSCNSFIHRVHTTDKMNKESNTHAHTYTHVHHKRKLQDAADIHVRQRSGIYSHESPILCDLAGSFYTLITAIYVSVSVILLRFSILLHATFHSFACACVNHTSLLLRPPTTSASFTSHTNSNAFLIFSQNTLTLKYTHIYSEFMSKHFLSTINSKILCKYV